MKNDTEKELKIVFTNSHADNRGDEVAQRGMVDELRKLIPNAHFTILTINPDGLDLRRDVEVIQTFRSLDRRFPVFHLPLIVFFVLLRLLGFRLNFLCKKFYLPRAIDRIACADIVVSCPGGPYFGDIYKSHELGEHVLHLFVAKLFRKPVMIYGPSAGPFRITWRNAIRRYILNKVEIITLRDPISREYIKDLRLTKPLIEVTSDSAFQETVNVDRDVLVEVMKTEGIIGKNESSRERPLVGLTPTGPRWNFQGMQDSNRRQKEYIEIMAGITDYVIKELNATVVFFSQLYGRSSDIPLIEEIIDKTHSKDSIRILSNKHDSQIHQGVIQEMDLMIANRCHAAIFALKGHVPTVCIAYEHKSVAVMTEAGMRDYVIDVKKLDYKTLVGKVDEVWQDHNQIKQQLTENIEKLRKQSRVNSIMTKALVDAVTEGNLQKDNIRDHAQRLLATLQ
ncbi:polysaccharide pyruvyl transferase family protein [Candidatus Pacearchaeota archaeon]|nr:polysaccharide pyruvyl transferase family protein [Candidatus Pacearchaeota archaeon]